MKINFFVVVIALLMGCISCSKDDQNKDEVKAAFEWQLTLEPGKVVFTNKSSNAVSYEWNFDDGNLSTVASPSKVYDQNGSYLVSLKAIGATATASVSDTVVVDNIPAKTE